MKAFILAGGFATRLWPLTEKRAKPMLLIEGKPILEHIIDQIPSTVNVYLLTNTQFKPAFDSWIESQNRPIEVFCEDAHSDQEKLGALAAVSAAIDHYNISDDLLILAGDNLLPELSIEDLFSKNGESRLALKSVPDLHSAKAFGVVELDDNKGRFKSVVSFEEKPSNPKSTLVSTGFMGLSAAALPYLQSFAHESPDTLGAVITHFLEEELPVLGFEVLGEWFDVGSYEAYLSAHKVLQIENVKIDPSAQVLGCEFKGKVFIGPGARVSNSKLIDTVVYNDTHLDDCYITQSIIDNNCHLEGVDLNRKLVRQGTTINNSSI